MEITKTNAAIHIPLLTMYTNIPHRRIKDKIKEVLTNLKYRPVPLNMAKHFTVDMELNLVHKQSRLFDTSRSRKPRLLCAIFCFAPASVVTALFDKTPSPSRSIALDSNTSITIRIRIRIRLHSDSSFFY